MYNVNFQIQNSKLKIKNLGFWVDSKQYIVDGCACYLVGWWKAYGRMMKPGDYRLGMLSL